MWKEDYFDHTVHHGGFRMGIYPRISLILLLFSHAVGAQMVDASGKRIDAFMVDMPEADCANCLRHLTHFLAFA